MKNDALSKEEVSQMDEMRKADAKPVDVVEENPEVIETKTEQNVNGAAAQCGESSLRNSAGLARAS